MKHQRLSRAREPHSEGFDPVRPKAPDRAPLTPLHQLSEALGNLGFGRFVQAKLSISEPGDSYEQEADSVADQVMRMSVPLSRSSESPPHIQRTCTACENGGNSCASCSNEQEKNLQKKSLAPEITPLVSSPADCNKAEVQRENHAGEPGMVSRQVADHIKGLNGRGAALPQSLRSFFEPRFGRDFSDVRVHTDEQAAQSAQSVKARAFTVGRDVVFGRGQYNPDSPSGNRLLAHELVHTIQQQPDAMKLFNVPNASQRNDQSDDKTGTIRAQAADTSYLPLMKSEELVARDGMDAGVADAGIQDASTVSAGVPLPDAGSVAASPTVTAPVIPNVHEHNTELGGLSVGNFDFHFRDCRILIWVWVRFQFESGISTLDQTAFKTTFFNAVHNVWGNSGYHLTGTAGCPCRNVPIVIHAQESAPGAYYHKLVDVERTARRESVISDMNLSLGTRSRTIAHEFGHVLGLYDEYDGGWWENQMFWHRNRTDDPNALMNSGTELRSRYFEHYRGRVQDTAAAGCNYSVSSPTPPVP